nr:EOG090X07KR [Artemia franciscana]
MFLTGGGSGFIGTQLQKTLRKKNYDVIVVSRKPGNHRISWGDLSKSGLPKGTTAVVNLAGQNVLDPMRRWSPGFKQNVWASRVNTTKSLSKAILEAEKKPKVFVSQSGVETTVYTEASSGGSGNFIAELAKDWESAAQLPPESGVRNVIIRSGVVLGRQGGMIKQLYPVFYLGGGGPIGSGRQYFPWIHVQDCVNLFTHAIENDKVSGVINGVAPHIITNAEFSKCFGRAMWRPAFVPLPEFAVNTIFGPDRAIMMLEGQKVVPEKALEFGFEFKFPTIDKACEEMAPLLHRESD